jgi:dTDP-4-amino-4,6-dideoxygalactose transaminase
MAAYKIPLFELNFGREEEEALLATIRSKWISMGEQTREAERLFAALCGADHAVAVSNCTMALHLALHLLGIKAGDEVIVPSLTFVATVNAVRYVGATPVFADVIGPHDLSIDPQDVRRKITPRTRAMVVMHYGGFPAPMGELTRLAREHGLFLVEDAAHAPGVVHEGRSLGTHGNCGCFSFYSNKNITCAEGGMLVTNDAELARRARLLRSHGMTTLSYERARGHATSYDVVELGFNYRLDDLRGALLVSQLGRLAADLERRSVLRGRYVSRLGHLKGLVIPYRDHAAPTANYIFPIVLTQGTVEWRDEVRRRLAERGVETSMHYPAVHRFSIYREESVALPHTEFVADHEITLPLYPRLREEQVDEVARHVEEVLA